MTQKLSERLKAGWLCYPPLDSDHRNTDWLIAEIEKLERENEVLELALEIGSSHSHIWVEMAQKKLRHQHPTKRSTEGGREESK